MQLQQGSSSKAHTINSPHISENLTASLNTVQAATQLELFGANSYVPHWPSQGTYPEYVLERLLRGRVMNHEDLIADKGSWRLAAFVKSLRYLGWPIRSEEKDGIAYYSINSEDAAFFSEKYEWRLAHLGR